MMLLESTALWGVRFVCALALVQGVACAGGDSSLSEPSNNGGTSGEGGASGEGGSGKGGAAPVPPHSGMWLKTGGTGAYSKVMRLSQGDLLWVLSVDVQNPGVGTSPNPVVKRLAPDGTDRWSLGISPTVGTIYVSDAASASDNGVLLVGMGCLAGDFDLAGKTIEIMGYQSVFVARLDAGGKASWAHSYSGVYPNGRPSVTTDSQGNGYVAIQITDSSKDEAGNDVFDCPGTNCSRYALLSLDSSGKLRWKQAYDTYGARLETASDDRILAAFTVQNPVVLPGGTKVGVTGKSVGGLLELSKSDGTVVVAKAWEGGGDVAAWDLESAADGRTLLRGNFSKTLDLGKGPLEGAPDKYGDTDFAAVLDRAGNLLWGASIAPDCGAVALAPGEGVYVGCVASADITVERRDGGGKQLWKQEYSTGATTPWVDSIRGDEAHVFVGGTSAYSVSFGPNASSSFPDPYRHDFLVALTP